MAPVTRIALSNTQRALLEEAADAGENGMRIRGHAWPAGDILTDWGLVTQFMRRGHAALRVTARGRRWLQNAPKSARKASGDG